MRDVDTAILTAKPTYTTTLALALEGAMLLDDAAQARYAAIYGEEWKPLSEVFASQSAEIEAQLALEAPANTNTIGRNDATGVL